MCDRVCIECAHFVTNPDEQDYGCYLGRMDMSLYPDEQSCEHWVEREDADMSGYLSEDEIAWIKGGAE